MTDAIASTAAILLAIKSVANAPCALHEPVLRGNAEKFVVDCIRSGWVSSVGEYVSRFERDLADYAGATYCVATVNGTAALHVALLLAGVQPGDEVIIPALSFVATGNAVVNCGATPHFVDVNISTLGMDPVLLRQHLDQISEQSGGVTVNRNTHRRIACIIPMHTFGHPCEIEELSKISERFQIPVVEDAAESLGSTYQGKHTGTFGKLGAISFNGNKIITTGGGGAILTNDEKLARTARHITTTAKLPHRWLFNHDQHAFNYRMPNINAALGCAQLEMLRGFVATKRNLADQYRKAFAQVDGVQFISEPLGSTSNYWLNAIRFPGCDEAFRDMVLEATNSAQLMTRPCWTPLNRLPMFTQCPRASLSETDRIFVETINIPSGCGLADETHS